MIRLLKITNKFMKIKYLRYLDELNETQEQVTMIIIGFYCSMMMSQDMK